MTFAYYERLSRAQQAIYRKSDVVTEIRLARPEALRPLVEAVAAALATEDRTRTQSASEGLVRGLTKALELPPVRVEVLAARPHARWGELHGLYTAEPGRAPRIQLWMRTAKQRRVVAFRTYLRTLLHEIGHHIDYTMLKLKDSFHTEGFYKRESSLFHQLVSDAAVEATPDGARWADLRGPDGRTPAHHARVPRPERLERLARTPGEVARLLRGCTEAGLTRRPARDRWSATEILCYLRDAEELFMTRFQMFLEMDDPPIPAASPAERWAEERQYHRQHAGDAWEAFSRRRDETVALLRRLGEADWRRGGIHPRRGRLTIDDFVSLIAWHDDNHLDQLRRALDGRA